MKLRNLAIAVPFSLMACSAPVSNSDDGSSVQEATKVKDLYETNYAIPEFAVGEIVSKSNPDTVCVTIDGVDANGIACWKPLKIEYNRPKVLEARKQGKVTFVEFKPALDENATCYAVDGWSGGALNCVVK